MKNHKKAKEFCEKGIYMEEGAKARLIDELRNEITNARSLKEVMQKLGEEYGNKESKMAIGILETMYELLGLKDFQDHIYDLEKFCLEWMLTNRNDLFDEAFNSMHKTAEQKNNEDLLKHLATYNEYIKNHIQAKELYEEIDPYKEYLIMVTDKIHKAPGNYTLKGLMEDLGARFAHNEPAEAISILEAIYEALSIEKDFIEQNQLNLKDKNKSLDEDNKLSIDALFSEAFYSMHEIAERHHDQKLLQKLEECYPTEEIPAIGEVYNM
ncbi:MULTISPECIES: hypothetical protein [unclassified Candidatus Tisiphia]|uniref:hypothetical protein n=1 Tax=unclassified Candidatus Tisiphia TaxID=2996318 RepID=UPI003CCB577D